MVQTAINLYSVRDLDEPVPKLLTRVADAGYDGVQFSGGVFEPTPEAVLETLANTGLGVPGAHVGIDSLEENLEDTLETYSTVGCDSVVVPWLDASHFASAAMVDETAERLSTLGERLAVHGFGLHYHNHDHEFVDYGDRTGFDTLIDATADHVGFELDVGWAATAGYDPVELLHRIGDRGSLVHMKDMDTTTESFREIGEGDVDMQACADAARHIGAEWLIYEHDEPNDPIASIDRGAEFLDTL